MGRIAKERRKRYRCYVCNESDVDLVRFTDWYSEIEYIICGECLKKGLVIINREKDEIQTDKLDSELPKIGKHLG